MARVLFFQSARGEGYVEQFIRSLDPVTGAKVLRVIELLETHGANLGMPYSRSLGRGLLELRVRGVREIRILYTFIHPDAYLLHAFQKKTRGAPRQEIALARSRATTLTP